MSIWHSRSKKTEPTKKNVQYYTTKHNKKTCDLFYTLNWEKKRFPLHISFQDLLILCNILWSFFVFSLKKNLKKKINSQYLSVLCAKKKDMIFLSLSYYDPPQEKKYTVFHKKQHTPVEQKKNKELFFQKNHHYYLGLFLLNFFRFIVLLTAFFSFFPPKKQ